MKTFTFEQQLALADLRVQDFRFGRVDEQDSSDEMRMLACWLDFMESSQEA
jgi:hypothetical protein